MYFCTGLAAIGSFDPQLEALSSRYRCTAWDAPGYGGSARLDEFTFANLAQCFTNLLEKLRIKPFAVIGIMGGMIAQTWVANGGVADKLVLAQTSARFGKPGSDFNKEFLGARLKPLDEGQQPADFAGKWLNPCCVTRARRRRSTGRGVHVRDFSDHYRQS